jgi:hypothetical protein
MAITASKLVYQAQVKAFAEKLWRQQQEDNDNEDEDESRK